MSQREGRERAETIWLAKLREAEQRYRLALVQTRKIRAEYELMSSSDGDFALEEALQVLNQAVEEYSQVLQKFTRLIVFGENPDESVPAEAEAREPEPVNDLKIQEWVYKHHGYVPHALWIAHCRELYLSAPPQRRNPRDQCPPDARIAIRQAFEALGMLSG